MRLICDANVFLSAILGRRQRPRRLRLGGAELLVTQVQLGEAAAVLVRLGRDSRAAREALADAAAGTIVVDVDRLRRSEATARSRLHARGQSDWPTLAAALELDAAIWSDDRDFFGVGVPVWSTWALDRHPILTGHDNG